MMCSQILAMKSIAPSSEDFCRFAELEKSEKNVHLQNFRKQICIFTESADSVIESQCLSVCMCHRKTPTSGGHGDLWSKNVILILVCDDTIKKDKII